MGSLCDRFPKPPEPVQDLTPDKPKTVTSVVKVVKALYDFEGEADGDLAFYKGEKMRIIDDKDPDWWTAEKIEDCSRGLIPSNFVIPDALTVESQEWWFDADRRNANIQLKHFQNEVGAFMVRKTEDSSFYALSVLNSRETGSKEIKHFRIRQAAGSFYLVKNVKFDDVISLVHHYQKNPLPGDSLCLGQPCTREIRNIPFKNLEINRGDIELGEILGGGMFGSVVKGTFRKRHPVAVKMLKENSIMKVEDFEREARIMHSLRHPRVVQLMGICMKDEPYYIITELMSNGSLLSFLKCNRDILDVGHLIDLAAQIADGMSYLERQSPPYIHRDLRAANCLVNENHIAKVADFGLAKMVDEGIYEGGDNCKFPVKWTAPEGLEKKIFSVKSDVWSYGILLYEIFTLGGPPYPRWDNQKIKEEVLSGYQLRIPSTLRIPCPEEVKDICIRCLNWESDMRLSFAELNRFFGNLNTGTDSYQSLDDK